MWSVEADLKCTVNGLQCGSNCIPTSGEQIHASQNDGLREDVMYRKNIHLLTMVDFTVAGIQNDRPNAGLVM